jgi:hypothetical protein
METLILNGAGILSVFIEMLKNHRNNGLKEIDADEMFGILIEISKQLYDQLIVGGKRKALQYLFQSVLLVPKFDFVIL